MEISHDSSVLSGARSEERGEVRVLSGPLPGHHLHHQDQAENPLLLLQPDRPLHPHRQHGGARLHPPPGLWGETVPRCVPASNCILYTTYIWSAG